MDCLTLGEPLICFDSDDLPLDAAATVRTYAVGAESNVAIGLARLGWRVGYVGRVGGDSAGRIITRTLRGEGVDVRALRAVDDRVTGLLLKEGDGPGRVAVTYHRSGSAGSTLAPSDLPGDLTGLRRLHVTGITLVLGDDARAAVLEAMRRARAAGARVSLDANFRRKLAGDGELVAAFDAAAPLADEVFLGRGEAALCAGSDDDDEIESYARALPASTVVLKKARGGATAFVDGARHDLDAHPVAVVDPVGSGDAFVVGFLHERLAGGGIDAALATGARVAARVIGRRGDYQGLPYRDDLVVADGRGAVSR